MCPLFLSLIKFYLYEQFVLKNLPGGPLPSTPYNIYAENRVEILLGQFFNECDMFIGSASQDFSQFSLSVEGRVQISQNATADQEVEIGVSFPNAIKLKYFCYSLSQLVRYIEWKLNLRSHISISGLLFGLFLNRQANEDHVGRRSAKLTMAMFKLE